MEDLGDMDWTDEEVHLTLPDHSWQLPSSIQSLTEKYDFQELERSNMLFRPYDPTKRVCSYDKEEFLCSSATQWLSSKLGLRSLPFNGHSYG